MVQSRFAMLGTIAIAGVLVASAAHAVDQDAIKQEVEGMNDSLPAMVSPVLREEQIRFNGAELAYTFTRVGPKADDAANQQQIVGAKGYLLTRLCGDPDTRAMMHDGVVFSFSYVDAGAVAADRLLINESDCAVLVH